MANFNIAIPIIAALEGGINRNQDDNAAANPAPNSNGAHTNKGVTWGTFVSQAGKYGYVATTALFLEMPDKIRNEIAKGEYWDALKLDKINSNKKAYLLFDWAFNSGPVIPVKYAQRLLGITEDGIAGPQFVAAVNAVSETTFNVGITQSRIAFIQNSSKIKENLKAGLIVRITELLKKKFQQD